MVWLFGWSGRGCDPVNLPTRMHEQPEDRGQPRRPCLPFSPPRILTLYSTVSSSAGHADAGRARGRVNALMSAPDALRDRLMAFAGQRPGMANLNIA